MTDLERRIREVLDDDARSAPPPHDSRRAVGRTRRRQGLSVAGAIVGVAALAAATVVGVRTVGDLGGVPADAPNTTTTTIDGVTITYPAGWSLAAAPANEDAPANPRVGVARLVFSLSPVDHAVVDCPVSASGQDPTFRLDLLEFTPSGVLAEPWPVPLQPVAVDTVVADVGGVGSGCLTEWEFLQATWTAEGRTFVARVAFAPEASQSERTAMVEAFASMTFEPPGDVPTSTPTTTVIASGTAGGEDWELVAERAGDELVLTLLAEGGGAGGSFVAASPDLREASLVLGEEASPERIVFGAVPSNVTRVEAIPREWLGTLVVDLLDVPDDIHQGLDAFVFVMPADVVVDLTAYDAAGEVVATGEAGPSEGGGVSGDPGFADGRHFGFVRSVDVTAGTIMFDLAEWLTGDEAIAAAAERGTEVTNDYFIVNDDTTPSTLPIARDVDLVLLDWNRCCDATFQGDLATFATAVNEERDVTDGDLVYAGTSSWWVTVRDGVVVRIEEQYRP